jgi:hypothetical protein
MCKTQDRRVMMRCLPEMVTFENDGEEIYVKKSECPLARYWASKYGAKVKVAWLPKGGGAPLLFDSDYVTSIVPGQGLEKGDTVWAVPSSTTGAFHDASLIEHLLSTTNAKDYKEIRRNLSEAGYPDDVLDAVPTPDR